ncbi:hypothetical protein [Sphingomonas sp.]|uniref:hypothetical protein n=1 Tax=Sphingomonas sp. TaxID=28214 RepID=UPI001B0F1232|nr:hypothetical protein [Sphingomonas sp.]MBO9713661.1 hypothetical protein [Sphingomonas sp.]
MIRRCILGFALATSALAAGPASAQDSEAQPRDAMGPRNLFAGSSSRSMTCQAARTIAGVDHRYRASFTFENNQPVPTGEGTFATASASLVPATLSLGTGVTIADRKHLGLSQTATFRQDWGKDYDISYELDLTLSIPGTSDQPLVSRVYLDGRQIWYQGLHNPKPGTSLYAIERVDKLDRGADPPHGRLRFTFERDGTQVADLSFDASLLLAREFVEENTKPLVSQDLAGGRLPPGCR